MARSLQTSFLILLFAIFAVAQQKPAATTKPAVTKSSGGVVLPSEEVVNAFLRQTFGYDSSLSWKIGSIKPSEAEGLA